MSLIDASYFRGELNIPNADTVPVQENLQIFIDKYEKKFLNQLLGKTLYDAFIAGIALIPVEPPTDPATFLPIDEKWINLKNQLRDATEKTSPIANYVYWYFQENEFTVTTGSGESKAISENAKVASPASKMIKRWDEMVDLSFEIARFVLDNPLDYGDYIYKNLRLFEFGDYYRWWMAYSCYHERIPEIFKKIPKI